MPEHLGHRRFPRYRIQLPLLHKPKLPSAVRAGVGWTRNLCEGGACVELAERFQSQAPLQVRLQTDRGTIESGAQVIWADRSPLPGGGLLHGIAFTEIAPPEQDSLRQLLRTKGEVRHAGVRLPLDLAVTCRRKGEGGPGIQGQTGDMSRGGLLLRLPGAPRRARSSTSPSTRLPGCSAPQEPSSGQKGRTSRSRESPSAMACGLPP